MVVCLERDADLHMAQLMPLPLTVSCFGKILTGFTFLVPAHPGSRGKDAGSCVCVQATDQINVLYVLLPAGMAASYAFMLPVATPPNAIAFSYGRLRVVDMVIIIPSLATIE